MEIFKNKLWVILLIMIGANQNIWSQNLIASIPIEEGKNITNLSGAVNDSITFHVIINKKSDIYNSKVYFFDKNKEINKVEIYNDTDSPNYLAFHVNDSILTVTRQNFNLELVALDINYVNGKTIETNIPFEPRQIFSHKNITFAVGMKMMNYYPIAIIKRASNTVIKNITPKSKFEKSFFRSTRTKVEFVNDKQLLENGPVYKYKGFYNGENLIFTGVVKKKGVIKIMKITPSAEISIQNIPVRQKSEFKRLSTFVKDSLLFAFEMYRQEAFLDIYKLNTLQKLKSFQYTQSNFGPHNKVVMRGKDITQSFKPKKVFNDFTPQKIGTVYNQALYVSVNKTVDNEYAIRIGHLDKNSYKNKSTGNYWWHSPAFFLNYNLNTGTTSLTFNGFAGAQLMIYKAFAEAKNTGNYFDLFLDPSLNETSNISPYRNYGIYDKLYYNRSRFLKKLKKHFFIVQKDYVRLINFDKKHKVYNIYNFPLNKYYGNLK